MAVNPARPLTQSEKDRLIREMTKSLPSIAPEDLFSSFVSDPNLMVKWDAPQQTQIADMAARQLLIAKAISDLAKKISSPTTATNC